MQVVRIYLAGPEVFLPDALAIAAAKKRICAAYGCKGVFPLDPPPRPSPPDVPSWLRLYYANEAHLRRCDALIANLTPFRGPSADVGTVVELGFMWGLGRPVLGYSNVADDFLARSLAFLGPAATRWEDGGFADADQMGIEDFGLADNLMIEGASRSRGASLPTMPPPILGAI